MRRLVGFVSLFALPCLAAAPRACAGNQSVGTFKLSVQPAKGGPALPIRAVNDLRAGEKLEYEPVHIPPAVKDKAEVALLLAPSGDASAELLALKPEPAGKATEWKLPRNTAVVGLVYGPHGLSMRKVKSLMANNQELLSELADYADKTSEVGALVDALQASEESGISMSAALQGFSSKYSVAMPRLDPRAPTQQQASTLLGALLPAMNTFDPLTSPGSAVMQQSAGLAAAVAGLFFGSPVGLAAGGASLFQNMRLMMFPDTEFRSAFAQASNSDSLALCAKTQANKSRTRVAYLWAHRVPELITPALEIPSPAHLPIGSKSIVKIHVERGPKGVERLRDWRLVPVKGAESFPVPVASTAGGIEIDLTKTKAEPGEYHLRAFWDWDEFQVPGDVYLHPYGNLKLARLAAESRDRLVEDTGRVPLKFDSCDFEFLEKLELQKTGSHESPPVIVPFTLPLGKRGGYEQTMEADLNTAGLAPGSYQFVLAQSDGVSHEIPVTILPPNPKIDNLPLRVNLGEKEQKFSLRGSGLDRLEKITTDAGEIDLAPAGHNSSTRSIVFKLGTKARKDEQFAMQLKVRGIEAFLAVQDAIEVLGPRPCITSVRKSYPQDFGVALDQDEIPAGATTSFALSVSHAGDAPVVEVSCSDPGEVRQTLRLGAGDRSGGARLDVAGEGMLFLLLDPGTVGRSGCQLEARVSSPDGSSDPHPLGRVLRVPRIEQFVLTDQKLSDGVYAGTLKGEDLDTIEQAGWDAQHGLPVQSIPAPVPEDPRRQTLKVALPWPAPAPHAPVFVWLRGESKGRATGVKY
jgi:hypothetical protein